MKKFLAIVLSVMMVLSVCTAGVYAFDEAELPAMPTQTENYIYFAADHVRAEANGTYEIPVYMISDYKTDVADGWVELAFTFNLSNTDIAKVVDVKFADGIQAVSGFQAIEAHYGYTEDEMASYATYHTDSTTGYVAFAAGLAALSQAKVQVCTITIQTTDYFYGGALYTEDVADFVSVQFNGYNCEELPYGNYFTGVGAGIFEGEEPEDITAVADFIDPTEFIGVGTLESNSGIYFTFGFAYHYVNTEPTWKDKLIEWFKNQVEGIFAICDTVREYIRTVLALI